LVLASGLRTSGVKKRRIKRGKKIGVSTNRGEREPAGECPVETFIEKENSGGGEGNGGKTGRNSRN